MDEDKRKELGSNPEKQPLSIKQVLVIIGKVVAYAVAVFLIGMAFSVIVEIVSSNNRAFSQFVDTLPQPALWAFCMILSAIIVFVSIIVEKCFIKKYADKEKEEQKKHKENDVAKEIIEWIILGVIIVVLIVLTVQLYSFYISIDFV